MRHSKFLLALFLSLFCATLVWGRGDYYKGASTVEVASHTDYTQEASCMAAYYMNSGDTETDRTGNGVTLSESVDDDIPTSATVPSGFSGTSRDFEDSDNEALYATEGVEFADGEYVDISGADAQITIVGWIRLESDPPSDYLIVNKTSQYKCYVESSTDPETLTCEIYHSVGTIRKRVGTTDLWTGTPTYFHIAMTSDDVNMTIYVNGSADTDPVGHTQGIDNTANPFIIGASTTTGSSGFDGLIEEVAIFNTALSVAQIQELMTYGIDGDNGGND